jgi:hypothetical protein
MRHSYQQDDQGNGRHAREQVPPASAATTWPERPASDARQSAPPENNESVGFLPQGTDTEVKRRLDRAQAMFIDDPKGAVAEAEQLATRLLSTVRDCLDRERAATERAGHTDGASTEDLRICMKRYRALIDRLLAIGC